MQTTFSNEVVSALADDAERLAKLYRNSKRRFIAIARSIKMRFPEARKEDRRILHDQVMSEVYGRMMSRAATSKHRVAIANDQFGRQVAFGRIPSRNDRHWTDRVEDRHEELHPPHPQGAA